MEEGPIDELLRQSGLLSVGRVGYELGVASGLGACDL